MKIMIITDAWAPQVNGVVRTLSTLYAHLVQQGDEVLMITPSMFRNLPCPTYPEIRLALVTPKAIAHHIHTFKPQAIHIATEGPLGFAARHVCRTHGYPFTTGYHTRFPEYIQARFNLPLKVSYAFLRWFHGPAKAVLVPTPSMAAHLQTQGFTNLKVWGRGVDTNLFKPQQRASAKPQLPTLLYVGRVAVEKNIEAFLQLKTPGRKVVVGDGPQLESLKRKFPNAEFQGAKHGDALVAAYAAADVFVFPSKTDTFGLVMLEALACGTPVAAYPVTGPLDVLTDPTAACLNDNLDAAVAKALTLKRSDCRAFAAKHSWASVANTFRTSLAPLKQPQDEM